MRAMSVLHSVSIETTVFLSRPKVVALRGPLIGLVFAVLFVGLPTVSTGETGKTFDLAWLAPSAPVPRFSQLNVKTLQDLGYLEGCNLIYVERWAAGSEERLRRGAAELVELKVDLINNIEVVSLSHQSRLF